MPMERCAQKKTPMKQIPITMLKQNSSTGRVRRIKGEKKGRKKKERRQNINYLTI